MNLIEGFNKHKVLYKESLFYKKKIIFIIVIIVYNIINNKERNF